MRGPSDRTKRLIDHYQEVESTVSQRQKARMEQSIWESLTDKEKKDAGGGGQRESFLQEALNESTYAYRNRHMLALAGVGSDELWHRIENEKMPLGTATRMLSKAKKHANRYHCTVGVAMNFILGKYDEIADIDRRPTGNVRKKKGRQNTLWGVVHLEVEKYAKEKLSAIDPVAARGLMEELETELKVLIDSWQSRLTRYKRTERDQRISDISRRDVIDSCSALSMDPPPPNQPVDIKKARKQQRTLAKLYHPDSHGGDESMRPKFSAVNDAYQQLVDYNTSLGKGIPTLTIIKGGK